MERIIRPTDKFRDNYTAVAAYNTIAKTHDSVFLTGGAGTGKSTLLKLIMETIDKNHIVISPTGIAARNVGGKTINEVFNFPPKMIYPSEIFINSCKLNMAQRQVLWNTDLAIVEEISMVNSSTLDCISDILKKIKNSSRPFGGTQMLFTGDLFQLPPVIKDKDDLKRLRYNWGSEFFFDAFSAKELDYKMYELTQFYRQKDDQNFVWALNEVRKGKLDNDLLNLLNEICYVENKSKNVDAVTLTVSKIRAKDINQLHLSKLPGKVINYVSLTSGKVNQKDPPADFTLSLKVGARVLFLKNNKKIGYNNGTLGTVISLKENEIIVRTDDGIEIDVPKEEWIEFEYVYDPVKKEVKPKEIGMFVQYPLALAWSMTVHKAQGVTLPKVHFDVCNGAFSAGQVYVALSRCTSIDNLSFERPLKMSDIIVSKTVKDFFISKGQKNKLQGL